ncbi:MAG: enoyl-acyl carrier protein reductase FabMG [Pseudobdellovibrionaceae bacterium]
MSYYAIRQMPQDWPQEVSEQSALLMFGELFQRGYGNGLIDAAEARGFHIIRSTVGRREKTGVLRALLAEELAQQTQPFINVPLEAGFDLWTGDGTVPLVEILKDIKLTEWGSAKLDFQLIEKKRKGAQEDFRERVKLYVKALENLISDERHLLIAHLMAGGVPRAKIIMPLMNRVFKGTGDRHISSRQFWESDLGQLCAISFQEVTAESFRILIEETTQLRRRLEKENRKISYTAYGYHGTEVLYDGKFQWQSYSPYLQGWAKKKLEDISRSFFEKGVACAVYNCPEILTNSSSIFQGVEIPLYPLLYAGEKNHSHSITYQNLKKACQSLLKETVTVQQVQKICEAFLMDTDFQKTLRFEDWPSHSHQTQMEKLLKTSDELIALHRDEKSLMTNLLSEVVFKACGEIMLCDAQQPQQPVAWINHDVISQVSF